MSIESIADTIKPKSQQLNADDLIAGPMTVTILGVRRGSTREQPVIIDIDGGHMPYMPCLSMRRVLIAAWGDDARVWVGRSATLYCDPSVKFGGVALGGIRISHLSHIARDMSLMLTTTRAKRAAYSVKAMPQYDSAQFADNLPKWNAAIAAGRFSKDDVVYKAQQSGKLTDEQISMIGA